MRRTKSKERFNWPDPRGYDEGSEDVIPHDPLAWGRVRESEAMKILLQEMERYLAVGKDIKGWSSSLPKRGTRTYYQR